MKLRIKVEGILYKPKVSSLIEWEEHKIIFDVDNIEDIRVSVDGVIFDWVKDPLNSSVILVDIPSTYICEKHVVEVTIIKLTGDLVDYDAYLENTVYLSDISYHNHFVTYGYDLGNNEVDILDNVPFVISLYLNSPSLDLSFDNSVDSQPRLHTDFIQYREPFTNHLHTYFSVGGVNQPTSREWQIANDECDKLEINNALFLDNYIGQVSLTETSSYPPSFGITPFSYPALQETVKTKETVPLIFTAYQIESIIAGKRKDCITSCDCDDVVVCDNETDVYTLLSTLTSTVNVDDIKTPLLTKRVLDRGIYNISGTPLKHEQIIIEEGIWLGQLYKLSFIPKKDQEYLFKSIVVFYDKDKPVMKLKAQKVLKTACIAEINRLNHKDWRIENNTVRPVTYTLHRLCKGQYVEVYSNLTLKEVECKTVSFDKDGIYKITFYQEGVMISYHFVVDTKLQECLVANITDLITVTCFTNQNLLLLSTLFWVSILFYHKTLQFENKLKLFPVLYEQDLLTAIELEEILNALEIYCRTCKFETPCCN